MVDVHAVTSSSGGAGPDEATAAPRGRSARRWRPLLPAAGVLLLAALPLMLSTYEVVTATQILAMSLLVMSLVLLMGHGGMISLGQAAFFGVGGYTSGLLASRLTDNVFVLMALSVLAGVALAASVGWLLLRARSAYFLMLTLAIGELVTLVVIAWVDVTGGSDGLANIPATTLVPGVELSHPAVVYWFVAAVVVLVTFGLRVLLRSPYGASLRGVRENEQRMRALGYSTRWYKFAAICIAGGIAGLSGSLWVVEKGFVAPSDMGFHASSFALLALIIGGSTSLVGAIAGAALIITVQNLLPLDLQGYGPLILGLTLIVAVYLVPTGLAGLARRVSDRLDRGGR